MNFYKHHIGDYDQATRHLSFVEDAAYCRLIRKYCAEEQPLPKEIKKIVRLIGARTKEEKSAVEAVLEEFFVLEEDGWHNKRCDAELETAWLKASKNREVGKLGGRPRKTETQQEPTDNPNGYLFETQTVSENNPSQKPEARHQTPELTTDSGGSTANSSASALPPPLEPGNSPHEAPLPMREEPPLSNDPAIQLSVILRRQGVNCQFTHPAVQDWSTKGVPIEILDAAIRTARERLGGTAKINPNYLVPIIADLLNPPAAAATPGTSRPPGPPRKPTGMDPKGLDESYDDYNARITKAEADRRKGQKP